VAVVANTWAAAAVAVLSLQLGLPLRAALTALWLSGLGFGALFTLFDPYSSDPLMFALGPTLTLWLLRNQLARTGVVAAAGVFAKEFAVAPLWIWAGAAALARRWGVAARTATVALAVTTLWLLLQLTLLISLNYSFGGNPSADLLGGGYIVHWFQELGSRVALGALFTEYGPLYVLIPLGFMLANRQLRQLALAAVPALVAFGYVQQPDRALWNFHFLVTPLAALVLVRVPLALALALLGSFVVANLRLAAQLSSLPAARYTLVLSVIIAVVAVVSAWREHVRAPKTDSDERESAVGRDLRPFTPVYRLLLIASAAAALAGMIVVADTAAHRAVDRERGLNRQGYRGEIMRAKLHDEVRVAMIGGATASSSDVPWDQSLAFVLARFLGQGWRWKEIVPVKVVDLAQPNDTAATALDTLRTYQYLKADIVCLLTGHNDLPGVSVPAGGRRESMVFRTFGYLPALPAVLTGAPMTPRAPDLPLDIAWVRARAGGVHAQAADEPCAEAFDAYCAEVIRAVDYSLSHGQRVIVVSEPFISATHLAQQGALARTLAQRYSGDPRVRYLNLGWRIDLLDNRLANGWKLTPRGIEEFADDLFTGVHSMVKRS
jgi:hypothetical protein